MKILEMSLNKADIMLDKSKMIIMKLESIYVVIPFTIAKIEVRMRNMSFTTFTICFMHLLIWWAKLASFRYFLAQHIQTSILYAHKNLQKLSLQASHISKSPLSCQILSLVGKL